MHVAAAVGTPVISLWGATNPQRNAPYGFTELAIQGRAPCVPCGRRHCSIGRICMSSITKEQIAAKVEQAFRGVSANQVTYGGPLDYQRSYAGEWRLRALADQWNDDLQSQVLELVRSRNPARHPQTVAARLAMDGKERILYLKIFHSAPGPSALKDLLRRSKAFRFWRQGVALHESGFHVPLTVAVGEQRRFGFVQRAFVLTESIEGRALPGFLAQRDARRADPRDLARKWQNIRAFGSLVRRFHRLGFVHGDMVASNILVGETADDRVKFYLMDNDRTRRFPVWFPQSLWRRNLVQLNRMPLAGISLQDRMRFLHAYLDAGKFSVGERKLARWLERKTRQRRKECDGVDPSVNFRRLMRWSPDLAAVSDMYTKLG
jgi:Lipopolysaccharide kinase (Kdo/WaaP) family/Glycosyltransferase family 9 (heptosyltransferase)